MGTTVSVLIRTKNEARDISKALELIRNQSWQPIEIIVVDSGSTDRTVEIVKQHSDINLIQIAPEEFTFGRSLNIGFQAARGEVVVSLSAHAFPCDCYWLENLVKLFDDPKVAGTYGKQVPQPDAWPPVRRDYLEFYGDRLRLQTRLDKWYEHDFSNANSAIRYRCWQERPFDETLTGSEDREWARAMLGLGYQIVYKPEAAVYHSHNEPLFKVYQRTYREALATNRLYGKKMSLRVAIETWYGSVVKDAHFILKNGREWHWLARSPIYRLFWTFGYLRPNLPHALWEPLINRWKRISHPQIQKE